MPELPEVETIRRELEAAVTNQIIRRCRVFRESYLRGQSAREFESSVSGRKVLSLRRRGKYLLFTLDKGVILAHLGMTGNFKLPEMKALREKHTAAVFEFEEFELVMNDVRRFGRLKFYPAAEKIPEISGLGVEPLESRFSADLLMEALSHRKRSVKEALLDQSIIAGLGNIYASEILFRAGIHPLKPCNSIDMERMERLTAAATAVLNEALHHCGATISDYSRVDGKPGGFQDFLRVYGRKGGECPACGSVIQRVVVSGRSSFFCPGCQKL